MDHPTDAPTSNDPLLDRLAAHVAARLPDIATDFARSAVEAGLVVTRTDGSERPIPIGALPVVLDDAQIAARGRDAAVLVAANAKVARWRLAHDDRAACLDALGPAERRLVLATALQPDRLAVARVDYLIGASHHALEINATIPAMQAYSDIAADAWLRHFARDHPELERLRTQNGRNAHALAGALHDAYLYWSGFGPGGIGLLCRRGDAQLSELRHLCAYFESLGWYSSILYPDQLEWRDGFLYAQGRHWPLIYRHIFLSRLDSAPCPVLEAAIAEPPECRTLILNAPAPHHEMKSTLAWLSRAASDDALSHTIGLDADERAVVQSCLPWTRLLRPDLLCEGGDSLDRVREQPADYVLKRAWSYGGNEVFVGRASTSDSFWQRVQRSFPEVRDWNALLDAALADARGGGFIVQRAVETTPQSQWLCTPECVVQAHVTTDYSAYTSLGVDAEWSGVCRAATDPVVNIVGGGGVVPLIRRSVAERLFQ